MNNSSMSVWTRSNLPGRLCLSECSWRGLRSQPLLCCNLVCPAQHLSVKPDTAAASPHSVKFRLDAPPRTGFVSATFWLVFAVSFPDVKITSLLFSELCPMVALFCLSSRQEKPTPRVPAFLKLLPKSASQGREGKSKVHEGQRRTPS